MKIRKPLKRIGKKGQLGIAQRREARIAYLLQFEAKCQSCQRDLPYEFSCFSHKLPRGRKVGNGPERGLYSCFPCNSFADTKKEYRDALIASQADMTNGLKVEWSKSQRQDLYSYFLNAGW